MESTKKGANEVKDTENEYRLFCLSSDSGSLDTVFKSIASSPIPVEPIGAGTRWQNGFEAIRDMDYDLDYDDDYALSLVRYWLYALRRMADTTGAWIAPLRERHLVHWPHEDTSVPCFGEILRPLANAPFCPWCAGKGTLVTAILDPPYDSFSPQSYASAEFPTTPNYRTETTTCIHCQGTTIVVPHTAIGTILWRARDHQIAPNP